MKGVRLEESKVGKVQVIFSFQFSEFLSWFPTFNELNALRDNIISSHRSSMLVPVSSRCHSVGDGDVIARLIGAAVPAKRSTHILIFVYHLFVVLNHI